MKKIIIIILVIILLIPISINIKSSNGICVLGYHGIVSDKDKETKYKNNRYFISKSVFEKQMKYLYEHKYNTLTMDNLYDYYYNHKDYSDSIALTFDDGYKNFNTVVKPILKKYNFKATCFVIGIHLNDNKKKFLKLKDIKNDEYASYYSHSYNLHRKAKGFDRKIIQDLTLEEIDQDFKQNTISNKYFAFPYGRSVKGIEKVLEDNNVVMAFSYNQFHNLTRNDNKYYLPRYMIVDVTPMFYFKFITR